MSLLSYNLTPTRADVVTDTLAYDQDGTAFAFTTKFLALPHINAVVVDRGATFMARGVYDWALTELLPGGIDDLNTRAPAFLRGLHGDYLKFAGDLLQEDHHRKSEIIVFGYSPSLGRMVGHGYVSDKDFEPVQLPDGEGFVPPPKRDPADPRVAAIAAQSGKALSRMRVPETFVAVGRLQKLAAEDELGYGIGGDLILCQITKSSMTMRGIHRFDDYDEHLSIARRLREAEGVDE